MGGAGKRNSKSGGDVYCVQPNDENNEKRKQQLRGSKEKKNPHIRRETGRGYG